jgi:RND superfamily putative drug exporter
MSSPTHIPPHLEQPHGALARVVRRISGGSAKRPKTVVALWLAFVVACVVGGGMVGTKQLKGSDAGVGQSASADKQLERSNLEEPAVESVLVRSPTPAATSAAISALERSARNLPEVSSVRGPGDTPALSKAGGKTGLVQVSLRGDPGDASDHIDGLQKTVASVRGSHPGVTLQQTGGGTLDKEISNIVSDDLHHAETLSLPITLLILIIVFGALVAASVPLLLGLTSVAAALGALGFVSQIAPVDDSTSSLVVLIGLAVGVDYSLFYVRREREERRAGRDADAALEATAATVGRAVVVSGITVMIALAGLLVTGLSVFNSIALGTMLVVAIAIVGSLTVLPAVLTLLGDKINRGRIPGIERIKTRRALKAARKGRTQGVWLAVARGVTRRPVAALVTTVCVLGAIAVPALDMHTSGGGGNSVPASMPVMVAYHAVEHAFPGSPSDAQLVVSGHKLGSARARAGLAALGHRAAKVTGGHGAITTKVAHDGRLAVVSIPMPDRGQKAADKTVDDLRDNVAPTASRVAPGAHALVTGDAASNRDFTNSLHTRTPIVILVVLALAMLLLVAAFRSLRLAASMVALNLLSVGASYGLIVAVFQHTWAEKALSFTSDGTITNWVPLFMFVILFGLSMDYTVLVLERVREARRAGLSPRDAAAEAVGATGSTVTGAAFVMVAIFAIFATLHLIQLKEWGVGLGTAVLLDATLIRGLALPAVVTLLGERGMKAPRRSRASRGWNDRSQLAAPSNAR